MNTRILLLLLLLNPFARLASAAEPAPDTNTLDLQAILAHEIVGPALVLSEVQDYIEPRVPEMPALTSAKDWTRHANRLRADVLKRVVLRGEAARWNAAPSKVEWLETIPGGPGYHIRKLRYEAVPGFSTSRTCPPPKCPCCSLSTATTRSAKSPAISRRSASTR
jgi:hypothetical protein